MYLFSKPYHDRGTTDEAKSIIDSSFLRCHKVRKIILFFLKQNKKKMYMLFKFSKQSYSRDSATINT